MLTRLCNFHETDIYWCQFRNHCLYLLNFLTLSASGNLKKQQNFIKQANFTVIFTVIQENLIYTYKLLHIFCDGSPVEPLCNVCLCALLSHVPTCCPIAMDVIEYMFNLKQNVSQSMKQALSHNVHIQLLNYNDNWMCMLTKLCHMIYISIHLIVCHVITFVFNN